MWCGHEVCGPRLGRAHGDPVRLRAGQTEREPMTNDDGTDVRARLLDMLLEKVAQDRYASTTMMNLIEELLLPDEVPVYAAVLLQKMREENYPSVPMMRRLADLIESA